MSDLGGIICLACGAELSDSLRRLASLRCHDCKELQTPLRADLAGWERDFRLLHARLDRLRAAWVSAA
jgi:hypothetical protein